MGEFLQQAEDSGGKFDPFTKSTEMDEMEELRIVLLGKTVGKSSVGNSILGEKVFKEECSLKNATQICQRAEKVINGRRIVVIDTPGIFDTDRSEEDLRDEIISSLVECAPGPHVFILVLKVERHTEENQKALQKLLEYFTDSIFPHMILLFTHGDDLDKNIKISDLIKQCDEKKSGKYSLKDVAEKCGNRVHLIDNRHWDTESRVLATLAGLEALSLSEQALTDIKDKITSTPADKTPWFNELFDKVKNVKAESQSETEENRNNKHQLTQLMNSVRSILRENNGQHYSNETLQEIGKAINVEVRSILQENGVERETVDMEEIRRRAIERVRTKVQRQVSGVAVGTLLGAILGVGVGVAAPFVLIAGAIRAGVRKITHQHPQAGGPLVQKADAGAGAAAGAAAVAGAIAEVGALTAGAATGIGIGVGAGAAAGAAAGIGIAVGAGAAAGAAAGIGAAVGAGVLFLYGTGKGGASGYKESKTSDNPTQAADKAAKAVAQKAGDVLKACWNLGNTETGPEYEPLNKSD